MTITLHGVNICQRALRCSSCPQSQNAGFALNRYCVSPLIESPLVSESPTLLRTPCLPTTREWFSGHCPRICRRFVFSCTVLEVALIRLLEMRERSDRRAVSVFWSRTSVHPQRKGGALDLLGRFPLQSVVDLPQQRIARERFL